MRRLLLFAAAASCGGPAVAPDPDPVPQGELLIEQIGVSSNSIGEAALIVGPDGTSVLIDVGNDAHANDVLDALDRRLGVRAVDWLVLTHFHADHIGALDDLFPQIEVRRGLVWRGAVDVSADAANPGEWRELCNDAPSVPTFALCEGGPAPCDLAGGGAPWPATGCEGLLQGDLEDPTDAGPAHLRLGDATLTFFAANGHVAHDGRIDAMALEHHEGEHENARSLAGVLRFGAFTFVFGGDLTGGGKGTPDVESFIAARAVADLPVGQTDVVSLNHHGIRSSTNTAWLDWLLPSDGRQRHALVGATAIYLAAPHQDVLDAVGPRLAGGSVWVTRAGSLAGDHEALREARGSVVIRAVDGGARYTVSTSEAEVTTESAL